MTPRDRLPPDIPAETTSAHGESVPVSLPDHRAGRVEWFSTCAACYGGDMARWPDAVRPLAQQVQSEAPSETQAILAAEQAFDAALAAQVDQDDTGSLIDWNASAQRVSARVMAALPPQQNTPAHPSATVIPFPSRAPSAAPRSWQRSMFSLPAWSMAATVLIGLAVGVVSGRWLNQSQQVASTSTASFQQLSQASTSETTTSLGQSSTQPLRGYLAEEHRTAPFSWVD